MWHPRPAEITLLGTTSIWRRERMLTRSTGPILPVIRRTCVITAEAAIQTIQHPRNLSLARRITTNQL